MMRKFPLGWFAVAALILIADQVTKQWVVASIDYGYRGAVEITPFFNLVHVYNYGAAFSFLGDAGGWQRWLFTAIAVVFSLVLVVWKTRLKPEQRLLSVALVLILGGALGNLYDRVMLGYVIDFLDFHWQQRHFPAFNVADSAISVGAALLLLDSLLAGRNDNSVASQA